MTEAVTLAHLSDLHLGPVAGFHPRYWDTKRWLGYLNWHRSRRFVHVRSLADALAADVVAQAPDHVAVTGDLANIGLPSEYATGLAWLAGLGDPTRVSLVPGNHDIYSARLLGASCLAEWAAHMTSDEWGKTHAAPGTFPFVRRVGPVAIVGVNSAVPTPPFVAGGRLGEAQLAALGETLETLHGTGAIRVVLIHHPPLVGQAKGRRGLEDARALEAVLARHGAELVLHGHNHRDMLAWRRWRRADVPIVGVASGSMGRSRHGSPLARYNLFRLSRTPAGAVRIEVEARGITADGGGTVGMLSRRVLAPDAAATA